ncbi:MAG TPA: DUF805 domain-containing protein [Burkholderiaceae bacterium]|nr:DUF805 domain-containing protein [Burkholderiaceae bacterium]
MDFKQAVMTALRKYVDFSGRATRPEFWWFMLFEIVVFMVTGMINPILYGIAALGLLLPGLGVSVRRLHDIGKSGWWLLLGFVPIVGVVLIWWFAQPGTSAGSRFGEAVGDASTGMGSARAPGQQ